MSFEILASSIISASDDKKYEITMEQKYPDASFSHGMEAGDTLTVTFNLSESELTELRDRLTAMWWEVHGND